MDAKNCENEHGRFRHNSGLNYVQKRANIRRLETKKNILLMWSTCNQFQGSFD